MSHADDSEHVHWSHKRAAQEATGDNNSSPGKSPFTVDPPGYSGRMSASPDLQMSLNPHKKVRSSLSENEKGYNHIAPRLSNKSVSSGTDLQFSPSRKDVSQEELSKTFEEWMRLVADNKINAKNSWDLALIDYFYEMSLIREGGSINFQRASCTLDGCVKIYTSRVDSVNSETRRLLDGLIGSYQVDQDGATYNNGINEENVLDSPGRKGFKKKNTHRQTSTLEENIENLNVQSIDIELIPDPLFKKASADFDRSGAHALLLNSLCIDRSGKIVLDSSEASITCTDSKPLPHVEVNIGAIVSQFAGRLDMIDNLEVCPDTDFKSLAFDDAELHDDVGGVSPVATPAVSPVNTENSPIQQYQPMMVDNYAGTPQKGYDSDVRTPLIDVGPSREAEEYAECFQERSGDNSSDNLECFLERQPILNDDEFSYFDNALVYKKETVEKEKKISKQKKIGPKSMLNIDFSQGPHLKISDVVNVSKKLSQLLITPVPSNGVKSVVTRRLRKMEFMRLFLKPNIGLVIKNIKSEADKYADSGGVPDIPGEKNYVLDINTDDQNDPSNKLENSSEYEYEDAQTLPLMHNLYEDSHGESAMPSANINGSSEPPPEYENQSSQTLNRITSSVDLAIDARNPGAFSIKATGLGSERAIARIDTRRLKKNLWKIVSGRQSTEKNRSFSCVFSSLRALYPEKKAKDITSAKSFVCLLDLANEHRLTIIPKYTSPEQKVSPDLEIIRED